ncbi:MAG TPA: hypothetical protein VHY35_06560 [Stellaceae bacterium]|jgi:anti-sigma factor RsiW|nr:hypothetical protein [Stellaceae bacterium]
MSTAAEPACDKVLLVQAEFDGELGAAEAAALAVHRVGCPICRAVASDLERARGLIEPGLYQPMPDALRQRMITQLAAARPAGGSRPQPWRSFVGLRGWWRQAASFGLGAACAAALAFLVITPRQPDVADEIVASHIRALQPGHLNDVASSDQHTVKPWFDGRVDFAPPVKDLAALHFPLIGGRLDYAAGRPVAALVYQRDKHLIDLYIWPAAEPGGRRAAGQTTAAQSRQPPDTQQRQGYNLVHWTEDGMVFWAVSDLEPRQLQEFVEDLRR